MNLEKILIKVNDLRSKMEKAYLRGDLNTALQISCEIDKLIVQVQRYYQDSKKII